MIYLKYSTHLLTTGKMKSRKGYSVTVIYRTVISLNSFYIKGEYNRLTRLQGVKISMETSKTTFLLKNLEK